MFQRFILLSCVVYVGNVIALIELTSINLYFFVRRPGVGSTWTTR